MMLMANIAKQATAIVLGIIFPIVILAQAYSGLSSLEQTIGRQLSPDEIASLYERMHPITKTPNDYALFSQMFSENVNQTVVTNKQIIKVVIIEIGFAAMSLGLMFVVLGINDGGGEGGLGVGDLKIDFKTASTGALVFLVGAAMATAGGVMRNEYNAVPLPNFISSTSASEQEELAAEAYEKCKIAGLEFAACFVDLYGQIYGKRQK